jgi:hypothetical protein
MSTQMKKYNVKILEPYSPLEILFNAAKCVVDPSFVEGTIAEYLGSDIEQTEDRIRVGRIEFKTLEVSNVQPGIIVEPTK